MKWQIDTSAGWNSAKRVFLLLMWRNIIKWHRFFKVESSNRQMMGSLRIALLYLTRGGPHIWLWLRFSDRLVIDVLLDILYIYSYMRGTISAERELVPWHSHAVATSYPPWFWDIAATTFRELANHGRRETQLDKGRRAYCHLYRYTHTHQYCCTITSQAWP